jgi:hypothetical protein
MRLALFRQFARGFPVRVRFLCPVRGHDGIVRGTRNDEQQELIVD